uniref:NADH-ubiquinone oxidoreductase chain 3 n=1 Tax=Pallaseopsis kessleri TaxID=686709 RepID=A0A1L5BW68_9CRUS|nr:NADH dehydrogenase subunit 3 [Pallaseopsis kessleri]APL97201.1 NADH dehydrogenase subunit 3 [Pallaseopsis kessleri]
MSVLSMMLLSSVVISTALTALALVVGKTSMSTREKLTSFECGFDSKKKARAPFSLRFFMVTILFLIFDVEVTLLLPLGLLAPYTETLSVTLTASTLALVLIIGIMHEWNQGSLDWTK